MDLNTHESRDDRYFRLTNFYASAFLFCKGLELVNIEREKTNSNRVNFVFKDTPQRELLLKAFTFAKENSSEVMVDARTFVMAIKMLKDKLYQYKL